MGLEFQLNGLQVWWFQPSRGRVISGTAVVKELSNVLSVECRWWIGCFEKDL